MSKSVPPSRRHKQPPVAASPGPARAAAAEALIAVLTRKAPLEAVIERHCAEASFAPRDRAFVHNLVLTTLRRLGEIEAAVASCLERPLPKGAAHARTALALGACQILFLRTPAHAAVATSVALAEAGGAARLKGLVNAVLRRIARAPDLFRAGGDAARVNTPKWLWMRWSAAFGEDACRRIAETHLAEPPLDLSVRADPELWRRRLNGRALPTGTVRLAESVAVAQLDGYAEGAWWVQDAAAALPVRLLGDVRGRDVFDLCAAPGGKTAQLANAGANVVAVDQSDARSARLRENLARLKLKAECVVANALAWSPGRAADAVLLDAPCTATGTIRRHPDIPRVRTPDDIVRLADTQAKLLRAAADLVRPGGILLYCVCSLEPEEGTDQVARFLGGGVPFVRESVRAVELCGQSQFVTAEGDLRTLPCHWRDLGGLDGFYAARLRRTGA
ncbi:MAG: MFS transporter [Rhodospirillales bacterium]|nr:MFS transporter [Rhodospirillales bacterium]